jgi:hypothetical protein
MTDYIYNPNALQQNDYHWSGENKRAFLEELSITGNVSEACKIVGKSRRAAYNARHKGGERGFRIGWDAAMLAARVVVQDVLYERALNGQQSETVRDPDNNRTVRHNFDNRMTMGLLTRLDKYADNIQPRWSDAGFAQIALQEFDVFLGLVEAGVDDDALAKWFAAREPLEWKVERHQLGRKGAYDDPEEMAEIDGELDDLEAELAWQNSAAGRAMEDGFTAPYEVKSIDGVSGCKSRQCQEAEHARGEASQSSTEQHWIASSLRSSQ